MTYTKKTLSVLLVISILISALFIEFSFNASAAGKKGTVIADSLKVRKDSNTSSEHLTSIPGGTVIDILGEKTGETITDGTSSNVWYNVSYNGKNGYVSAVFVKLIPEYTYDQTFEDHIAVFPESYKPYLRELHAQYPNWKFYRDDINMSFEDAVYMQVGKKYTTSKKLSYRDMSIYGYDWEKGIWSDEPEPNYYFASREVIKYYMDPRYYLNSSSIFAFLQQNYDASKQTEEGLNKILSGTFLANGYSDPNDTAYGGSYSKVLMEAAKQTGVNPYVLAATIIQEQGTNGTSPIISGQYKGYENLYNFFNIRAYGVNKEQIYINGLTYARTKGWTTRSKAIIEGAGFCATDYINDNQYTFYLMNFNVKNQDPYHQYATAIHDTNSKAIKLFKSYGGDTSAELSFSIPVYKDMPESVSAAPIEDDKVNNYYFTSISVEGLTPTFNMFSYEYDLDVGSNDNTTIKLTTQNGAYCVSAKSYSLNMGQNRVVLTVKSQTGYLNNYIINVRSNKSSTLTIDAPFPPEGEYLRGDSNNDGYIDGRDLADIQLHILQLKFLTGERIMYSDTDSDGDIDGRDLANVQLDILELISLN